MSSSSHLLRQPSWHSSNPSLSKFREHLELSINPPAPDRPLEKSQFSPESIEQAPSSPQGYFRLMKHAGTKRSARSPTSASHPHRQSARANVDLESASAGIRSPRSMRDRLTQFFFDIRTMKKNNSDHHHHSVDLSSQDPWTIPLTPPPAWPPLHIEKRHQNCECGRNKKRSPVKTILLVVLVIILLYLLIDSAILTANVIELRNSSHTSPSSTSTVTTGTNNSNPDVQSCLTQYTLNAPSSPSSYPCSSCLPLLQNAAPSQLTASGAQQTASDALQFCGLRAIFESASTTGQSALGQAGWVKDNRFCAWQDVSCDGSGKVSALKLTFPAVPAVIPSEIGALTGLTTLSIIGDGNVPAGKPPAELTSLPALKSLDLESTALSVSPNISSTLTTLKLIKNAAMSPTLPSSLPSSSLTSIVINSQTVTNPLAQIGASSSLQASLQVLDLTQTQLSGAVPSSLANLHALTEIHLDGNQLTGSLPAFGKGVIVTAKNNTGLQGA